MADKVDIMMEYLREIVPPFWKVRTGEPFNDIVVIAKDDEDSFGITICQIRSRVVWCGPDQKCEEIVYLPRDISGHDPILLDNLKLAVEKSIDIWNSAKHN